MGESEKKQIKNQLDSIKFSKDLLKSTKRFLELIDWLEKDDQKHLLYHPSVLKNARRRYETKWMPLISKQPIGRLLPPIDVYLIWIIHMLSPRLYAADCIRLTGQLVQHKLIKHGKFFKVLSASEEEWKRVNEKTDPFDVDLASVKTYDFSRDYQPKTSFDLSLGIDQLKRLKYQVGLLHYRDERFINTAIQRYKRLLLLLRQQRDALLIPTVDIAVVWSAHRLNPLMYRKDCKAIIGDLPHRDDFWSYEFTHDSEDVDIFLQTRTIWRNQFSTKFYVNGAVYRGDLPTAMIYRLTLADYQDLRIVPNAVMLFAIRLNLDDGLRTLDEYERSLSTKVIPKFVVVRAEIDNNLVYQQTLDPRNLQNFANEVRSPILYRQFDRPLYLHFEFHTVDASTGDRYQEELASCPMKLPSLKPENDINYLDGDESTFLPLSAPITFFGENVQIGARVTARIVDWHKTKLRVHLGQEGIFNRVKSFNEWRAVWGPMAVPTPHDDTDFSYSFATHRLFDVSGSMIFTARVIHCLPLRMSAVHIGRDNRLMALVHSIGAEHLPHPKQLYKPDDAICLQQEIGERALFIKTFHGDECIVKGIWKESDGGYLFLTIYMLSRIPGRKYISYNLKLFEDKTRQRQNDVIQLENNFKVDLHSSIFEYDWPIKDNSLECSLGISWACLLLAVLCLPKPKMVHYPLMTATGYEIDTPSNYYLYKYEDRFDIPIGDSSFCPYKNIDDNDDGYYEQAEF